MASSDLQDFLSAALLRKEVFRLFTLQQLKCFCTLAKELHYTKAAESLHITQPTLSYAISELQKEIGAVLFQKEGNRTELTEYGVAFLPYAEKTIAIALEGKRKIENMVGSVSGSIGLGYIYSVSFDFLPAVISGFQKEERNRNTSFQFFQGIKDQLIRKLTDGTIDLAIANAPDTKTIRSAQLFKQNLFLVVPKGHRLAREDSVSLSELENEAFILDKQTSGLRVSLDQIFSAIGIKPKIAYEVEECNAMVAFVSTRQGIAIMPRIPLMDTYDVSVVKISDPSPFRYISLLWNEERPMSSVAKRFKEHILSFKNFVNNAS